MQKVSATVAIKRFFEQNDGRKVEMAELKALSSEERAELGALSAAALGLEIKEAAPVAAAA